MFQSIRKVFSNGLLLSVFVFTSAHAQLDPDTPYYANPRPNAITNYIQTVNNVDGAAPNKSFGFFVGFMSEQFIAHPNKVDEWLQSSVFTRNTQIGLVYALALAQKQQLALPAMKKFGWSEEESLGLYNKLQAVTSLQNNIPNSGNDLDMFWGAFFATGSKEYVERVIWSYQNHINSGQLDPEDVFLMADTQGSRNPDPVALEKIKTFRNKYGDQRAYSVAIASTALWALGSNVRQHDRVRDITLEYLKSVPDSRGKRNLEKYLAHSSLKINNSIGLSQVMFITTSDPKFVDTQLKTMLDGKGQPRIDKVFAKQDVAFGLAASLLKPKDVQHIELTLVGSAGLVKQFSSKANGSESSQHSITVNSFQLNPPDRPTPQGLYELLLITQTNNVKYSFRTMVFFEYE